jgi:hypothetical protein
MDYPILDSYRSVTADSSHSAIADSSLDFYSADHLYLDYHKHRLDPMTGHLFESPRLEK